MKKFLAISASALALSFGAPIAVEPAAAQQINVAVACSSQVLVPGFGNGWLTITTNGDLCTNATGGGGGGTASFTAAAAPFAVTAGANRPAGIDTANSAQFTELVVPGTTTTYDPTSASKLAGVSGANSNATFANPVAVGPTGNATAGMSTSHAIVANNTTSVAIDASPGTLYSVQVFNNSATIAYLKLYDAAQGSTTCGTGTPKKVIMIPANTSGAGAVVEIGGGLGVKFSTAITRCVTTGIADNDTTAPAASTYLVEADYS